MPALLQGSVTVGWNKLRAVPALRTFFDSRLPELRCACSSLQNITVYQCRLSVRDLVAKEWARIKFPISDHVMPAQAGTQFFAIRCEIRWVPACAGMTETNYPWFKSGSYFGTDPKSALPREISARGSETTLGNPAGSTAETGQ
jgi:hypothetical protein